MFGGVATSLEELDSSIKDLSKSLTPLLSPFLTTKEVDFGEVEKELTVKMAETKLGHFMDECHLRTKEMGDSQKCTYCKLRFRCYTEATNKTRDEAKSETYARIYGEPEEIISRLARRRKPKKRGKSG